MVSLSPSPKLQNVMSSGCHSIPKTRRHIWDRGIEWWWDELVWFIEGKGLGVKWMVDEAGRLALILLIPLMISHDLVLLKAFYLLLVKSMSGNKWRNSSLLLNHPELAQRWKNHFLTIGRLVASAISWLQPLQLFPMGMGQTSRVKPASIEDFKTAVEDINVAILDKYICATAATIKKRCKAFCLQMVEILGTFWHPCRLGISQY